MPYVGRLFCVRFFLACLLTTTAIAQRDISTGPPQPLPTNLDPLRRTATIYSTLPGTGVLVFTVYNERKGAHLDRQALLKLVSPSSQSPVWQTTLEDTSQGVFANLAYGNYNVEVSAVGYLSTQKEVQVPNSLSPVLVDVMLRRDPDAINLDVSDRELSPKARKQAKRAVSALKSGNFKEAQKQLDEAHQLFPYSPDLNFLLGYLYFQKRDFTEAGTYLGAAASLNPHNAQALTLLGRTGLERQDYPAARSALEQAVLADAENWLPHNLLADAYLHQKDYDKARDEAQIAITKGKTAASPAQLVLGQALVNLGHDQEAIQALNVFLDESPKHPMAEQVRSLIADIQQHESTAASSDDMPPTEARLSAVNPLSAVAAPALATTPWQPPGIDDVKTAVASGVECPSAQVIEESGKRVQELVHDVARFAAVEDLFHESLDPFGVPVRTETRKYNT